jgi:molybdopterin converting factor small subunit
VITVHLYGKLRRFAEKSDPSSDSIVRVPVGTGETIGEILKKIGIPKGELGSNIFLNGEYSGLTRAVKPGDRLGVFPDDMQLLYKWYFTKREGDSSDDPG